MFRISPFEKLLVAFLTFIGILILCRIYFSGSLLFIFLAWNIFLAWIPYKMSQYLVKPLKYRWMTWFLMGCWLLFFPNALYIITDLVHLELDTSVPKWFDAILLLSSSLVGLIMAFVSLSRVEFLVVSKAGYKKGRIMIMLFLALGSFGVYLGRFLRWNSWDIINQPSALIRSIGERLFFPWDHTRTWGMTLILTVFYFLVYESIKRIPGYVSELQEVQK